MKLISEGLRE